MESPKKPYVHTPPKPKPQQPPEHVVVFYDERSQGFLYKLNGRFVALKKADLKMHFRAMGLRDDRWFDGQPEIEWPLWRAQVDRLVSFAGSLAGRRSGIFSDGSGRKFLVTDEPKGIWEPVPKKFEEPVFFKSFVQELLPDDQHSFLCHWMAVALRSFRAGDFRPGQLVVLAGPANCGKSLLQYIITQVFGGRSADPFRYISGETQFNSELIGAEHWLMEDPPSSTDMRSRRAFGEMLKACVINDTFSIQGKGKDAINLPIARRLTLSVNDETENLSRVPPLEESLEEKVFLFKCDVVKDAFKPFYSAPSTASQDREELSRIAIRQKIEEEVPLIRAWLLKNFKKLPPEYRDSRFIVRAWHHPELMAELSSLSPEVRLLGLIDQICFSERDEKIMGAPVTGKSMEIESRLRDSKFAFEVEKILRFPNACGTYLGRLSKRKPERVVKSTRDGYVHWIILPPPTIKEENGVQKPEPKK